MELLVASAPIVVAFPAAFGFRARQRRAGRPLPPVSREAVVAYSSVAVLYSISAFVGSTASRTVRAVLELLPLVVYLLLAVDWLVRHRGEIAEGWKTEGEEERRRRMTGKQD